MRRRYGIVLMVALLAALVVTLRTTTEPIMSMAPGLASSFTTLGTLASAPAGNVPATTAGNVRGMSVVGPPSVSPALIEQVLAKYDSPAAGKGQVIYDLGVKYGIDPAFLLAFFIHESSAGTSARWAGRKPNGTTTHNVGNIVCTTGWRCHGRFRDYASWEAGIEDWYRLIRDLYIGEWGRTTVEAIIPKYAPASDNNDEARYIGQVRTMVEGWRNN